MEWLGNGRPPWAAYRVIMSVLMITMDKQPGIRPVRVGETWRRLMAKCLLKVAGPESKTACGTTQLAGGLEAGIEGAIHVMRVLWEDHKKEEDWGFLLIDACNAFNEENRTAMLWAVRNEWPSGAQFTFNCYRHWAMLVVRDIGDGSCHFLHSKYGVTQGDPLAMITYGIGVLPLIQELRDAHSRVTQLWYADYAGAGGGGFQQVQAHFLDLQARRPARGYYLEPTKSIWSWPWGTSHGLRSTSGDWA